ncbi:MAG: carbon-nitrogen hydrolase family protein [Nitrospinaceae bacterium]|jgi:predicted amidohydrolase|nr:carbon-nitrogen hydrolase family protein [Nitrospinaceae bacterium]MBT3433616.1 carbon-nitrogen hydrolase family protein [Nitrospinaceae bacterium]MBT3821225.1 carbon-nitrogen hydrolase family protein [Nitrospinaceae bacterium]MBT4094162.1 carbon-nitrogen hydrolase family protein [Nitrospinaceae bacterium]MBT4430018.1 carbon-nitrogen hydrolase family protein [Nitrospinaceae bacterium]
MSFRIAVVQPMSHMPPDDEKNVDDAIKFIEQASAQGAEFITFPESYPGPWRMPATFDPNEAMAEAAKRCGVYVQYGTLEPIDNEKRTAYNLLMLARPGEGAPGKYRRTHPPGPWIYRGGKYWDFNYTEGNEYPVFETPQAQVGLAMCSEVYMPEVSRALSIRGAEIIFLPAGVDKRKLWGSWRNLIWSRAIENLAVVVTTQNLFDKSQRGLAMVATPEEVIFESTKEGMFLVDVDLDRIRDLRAQQDSPNSSEQNGAKAGILSQWQRPDMYDKFLPKEKTSP